MSSYLHPALPAAPRTRELQPTLNRTIDSVESDNVVARGGVPDVHCMYIHTLYLVCMQVQQRRSGPTHAWCLLVSNSGDFGMNTGRVVGLMFSVAVGFMTPSCRNQRETRYYFVGTFSRCMFLRSPAPSQMPPRGNRLYRPRLFPVVTYPRVPGFMYGHVREPTARGEVHCHAAVQ